MAHVHVQEWRYKNAVRVGAEDAARHGLQEGALVLESTLAGTPSSSQEVAGQQQNPAEEATVSHPCLLHACMQQLCSPHLPSVGQLI